MSTYYYKGRVYASKADNGTSKDGYVTARSTKDALCKIREEVGGFDFDTIRVTNGTTGKVVAENIYSQPISRHEGRFVWIGK